MIICACGLSWTDGQEKWAYHHWRVVSAHQKRGHKMKAHALEIILPTTIAVLEAVKKYDLAGLPQVLDYALQRVARK